MRPDERNLASLWDMREAARLVQEFVAGATLREYSGNRMMQSAVERQLEIIGEAARRVSMEFRALHPEIPWRQLIAQRNVLTHEYGDVLPDRVWDVANHHVPQLAAALDLLLPEEEIG